MEVIRILHVFHGMDCGGAENMVMNLYRKIDRSRIQFDFLVHTEKKCFFDDEINKLGGRIFRVSYFNGFNIREYRDDLNSFFIKHKEFSVVHGHLGSCASIYLNVAKKYGCYTIAHSHSSKPSNISIKNIAYRLSTYKVRRVADFFMGCSLKAGEYRYGKKIVKSDRFKVLNNAIDTNLYVYNGEIRKKIREKLEISPETILIGHVGRFTYAKNHDFLLAVFEKLAKKTSNTKLLLVGDGELRANIEKTIETYKIKERVILTGVVNNVSEYLQAMDVFVFPSRYEGLPVSVIEAQAADLPCFISEAITDEVILTNRVKTFPIDVDSTKTWVDALEKVSVRAAAVDRHEDIIKSNYDIGMTVKWLEHFYMMHSFREGTE